MELSFALVNQQNIRTMMKELLTFLEKSDNEFKVPCSSSIVIAAERHAPNKKWHLDTLLKVLVAVSSFCGQTNGGRSKKIFFRVGITFVMM